MKRYRMNQYLARKEFLFHIFPLTVSNRSIKKHCHEFVEFVYVISGSGIHEYQGKSTRIEAGDVLFIEPETPHAFHVQDETLVKYNVLFQPSFFAKELSILFTNPSYVSFYYLEPFLRSTPLPSHLHLLPTERVGLQHLLDQITAEYQEKKPGYDIIIKTKLVECFIYLSRCYQDHKQIKNQSISELMDQVKQFIELHYDESFSLYELSQICGMSESSLRHHFKAHTGYSLLDYRNNVRLKIAEQLLQNTKLPISEIALEIGFNDISFFNRLFRKNHNMSPRQYRKQTSEQASTP